ncbi:MAG: putative Ig domain-containing protein, partial [Pirellulales bacterium]|nr:putative Ig domain-containing protein [Pirellulales bacterium]
GVRLGRPVIYRIPATGKRPMTFTAEGLPEGLKLDSKTGIITGTIASKEPGDHNVTLEASNEHGKSSRPLKFVVGDTLALTPPMGWNSWYIHYHRVSDKIMREAADQMIASGMADYGYSYVNIDDCWMQPQGQEPYRGADGAILCNKKFPDMKAMNDYIHAKGLKSGLYTSPGEWTCARYVGSYKHELIDASQFAKWGFDFLKYDLCTYGRLMKNTNDPAELQVPYKKMGDILKTLDRDIVYNLCEYGKGSVWKWGCRVGGNCWRTTGDLGLEKDKRLPGFYYIGFRNAKLYEYAKPGCWNDPDYILIGYVGDARKGGLGKPTTLSGDEQYAYMSMWSLMAAPLIFSGDMAKLDEFTLNVLCNCEVIDINQDPLGKQAKIITQTDDLLVLAKPMQDGSLAVGLFNLGEKRRKLTADWAELGLTGPKIVRDVWRHRDIGTFDKEFTAEVNRHGICLIRLRAK